MLYLHLYSRVSFLVLFLSGTGKQKWVPLPIDPPPSRPPPSKGARRDRDRYRDRPHESRDHGRMERDSYHSGKNGGGYRDGYRGDRGRHGYEHRGDGDRDRDYHRGKWKVDSRYNVPPRWASQTGEEGEGRGGTEGSGRGYGGGYRGGRGRNWRYPNCKTLCIIFFVCTFTLTLVYIFSSFWSEWQLWGLLSRGLLQSANGWGEWGNVLHSILGSPSLL